MAGSKLWVGALLHEPEVIRMSGEPPAAADRSHFTDISSAQLSRDRAYSLLAAMRNGSMAAPTETDPA